ncbi:oxygenase MpaB family protein [Mycobacterium sp. CVI_P3]|uniref:Oxygenase MpaB family protein n=1 Tax=Mycobacterium pinniadriaticum TaxID=2994102 RepID=A0ABT3SC67_9MYCO|nr:oxygenase MpaB family protein [Mycobacterium pinniadriaticum]MCX2930664.1 oxygenase MpaB family protein [Mycobacterium pinniadriaticum]MCX2937088.1 oxygenase MpaB family protein [Mycobacterium pinniadriaticum]
MTSVTNPDGLDIGWVLGPGSVTWTVLKDPTTFLVGLLREALLLALHPPFAAAAVDHDSFGDDPVMRFKRVAIYTYAAAYGTKVDAHRVSAMVLRSHARIVGNEPLTQQPYRADSEYELALTQAMLAMSFLAVHEQLYGELPTAKRDQFVLEQKLPGALIGVNPLHLPSSYSELTGFLGQARMRFATGAQARETIGPFAAMPFARGTVIGDLPPAKRRLASWAARAVADMAMLTMNDEERTLLAIDRAARLGSRAAVRRSLRALSAYLRSDNGMAAFGAFLGSGTAGIFHRALEADRAPGRRIRAANFRVPDAMPWFHEPDDLVRNWPGSPGAYVLGQGDIQLVAAPTPEAEAIGL